MQSIRTRFYGPTNARGARIIAINDGGEKYTWMYDHELDLDGNHRRCCEGMLWILVHRHHWPTGRYIGSFFKGDCYWTAVKLHAVCVVETPPKDWRP